MATILREDLGLIGAAWIRSKPRRRAEILERLSRVHATLPSHPSLRSEGALPP